MKQVDISLVQFTKLIIVDVLKSFKICEVVGSNPNPIQYCYLLSHSLFVIFPLENKAIVRTLSVRPSVSQSQDLEGL
jgi:hypothetical protein